MSQTVEHHPTTAEVAPRRWTRAEFLRMVEVGIIQPDERVELIEGEIEQMPAQLNRHVAGVTLANRVFTHCFSEGYWVRVQATLALGDASLPDPDIAVVEGDMVQHSQAYPESAVLVVEISDSTLRRDQGRKSSLYAKNSIPDYWVVNLVDHCLEVRRKPLERPEAPFGWDYGSVTIYRAGESVAPLAGTGHPVAMDELLPDWLRE